MGKRKGVPWGSNHMSGSTHRRKRKSKKPLGLHATLRQIAWPIGESEEIYVWIQFFKLLPSAMFTLSILVVFYWFFLDPSLLDLDESTTKELSRIWAPPQFALILAIPYCMLKPTGVI